MSKLTEEIKKAIEEATVGPWSYGIVEGFLIYDNTFLNRHIARIVNDGVESEDREEANAKLIANAPTWLSQLLQERKQMVEAIKYMLEYWNRDNNEIAMEDALWKMLEIGHNVLIQVGELE